MVAQSGACRLVQTETTFDAVIDFATLTHETADILAAAGHYFVIRCTPDPFTGEALNVGICVVAPDGRRHVKVITEPGRLECLYGENGSSLVVSMAGIAGACAQQGLHSPSEQIVFDDPLPFYNVSSKDMLEAAFAEQVTVAIPRRLDKSHKTIDDEAALRLVTDEIKKKLALQADFLADSPQIVINTDKGPRAIRVPILPARGAGTVRSADYSTASLKAHLMDSLLDIECAGRYRNKPHLGIFILRPKHHTPKQTEAIDNVIDSIAFRAPKNLRLEVEFDSAALADRICEWAEAAA